MSHVTHVNESRHTNESVHCHVTHMKQTIVEMLRCSVRMLIVVGHTCEWVMSHMWMRHVTHIWMSHVAHVNESCHTYEWVTSHIWMRHVTRMNASCHECHTYECVMSHIYEWVMSHVWMSHVTRMNASRHTYEWVHRWDAVTLRAHAHCRLSHTWMRHVTHMNEACHTCEGVMSHVWMSQATPVNKSRHTHEWVYRCDAATQRVHAHCCLSHICMSHVTHVNKSRIVRALFQNIGPFRENVFYSDRMCSTLREIQTHGRRVYCGCSRVISEQVLAPLSTTYGISEHRLLWAQRMALLIQCVVPCARLECFLPCTWSGSIVDVTVVVVHALI